MDEKDVAWAYNGSVAPRRAGIEAINIGGGFGFLDARGDDAGRRFS